MKLKLISGLVLLGATSIFATPIQSVPACVEASLASYVANFGNSNQGFCQIGALAFSNFYFDEIKVTSNSVDTGLLTAADFRIVPVAARNSFDIIPYDVNKINGTVVTPQRYLISWYADPPPIIAGDELFLDPPTGKVYGTKWGCLDSSFGPSSSVEDRLLAVGGRSGYDDNTFTCRNGQKPYVLKTDGDPNTAIGVQDSISFPDPGFSLDIRLVLDFEPGEIRGFDGIQVPVSTTIPEPAANVMIAGGLTLIVLVGRRRFSR